MLKGIHHTAIICSNYTVSKHFYTAVLGLKIIAENFREDKQSYKLDLLLPNGNQIELFSFPEAPQRLSYPEALGLRHLAFTVDSVNDFSNHLKSHGVETEPVRIDEYTGNTFTFFTDPDGLPLEIYESEPDAFS